MGKEIYRTDYAAREIYQKRAIAAEQRGDHYRPEIRRFEVAFSRDFDKFVARVAYELRGRLLYRTDGGRIARGLVSFSGHLELIHDVYMTSLTFSPEDLIIRLEAHLWRRRDQRAENQVVMIIHFKAPDWEFGDPVTVTAPEGESRKTWMTRVLETAHETFKSYPGDQSRIRRIRLMIDIAERIGYPRNYDLWIYTKLAVWNYVNWDATELARSNMTQKTGGVLPFNGWTGQTEWRVYPFKSAAERCIGQTADDCVVPVTNALIAAEREMFDTFTGIDEQIRRVSTAQGNSFSFSIRPAEGLGPLADQFVQHIGDLQKRPDSLYLVSTH